MDWSDFGDWLSWLLLGAAFLLTTLMALMTIVVGVYQVIRCVQAHRRGCSSVVDELLREIILKDHDIPPGGGEDDEVCAICVTPYESGEACSVLPACTHMFHKPCVAK
ncbi:hypothetical protein HU200_030625 [Digitaria exilis]|uniref:RING-type domain-containing protein n=1 Tax=Digitaria exilis TaxID=1010633 RepID=A0A835BNJ4_9POAL|nr:hypothetical protein HU200_030625 [Digitaria exilis]